MKVQTLNMKDYERRSPRVLILDGSESAREKTAATLKDEQLELSTAASTVDALEIANRESIEVVVVSHRDTDGPAPEIVADMIAAGCDCEFVVLTSAQDDECGRSAVENGAFAFLAEPVLEGQLGTVVSRAARSFRMRKQLHALKQTVAMSYGFDNIIGISKPMLQMKETARRLAPTEINLLITGGPGTGKELLARAMHHHSRRRSGPFVAIDCAAVPEAMLDYELLGGAPGSVDTERESLVEKADGGTLFLDEVNRLPEALQERLDRFLMDTTLSRPGRPRRKIDLRIISSCNHDLQVLALEGEFLESLRRRLAVIPLDVPGLNRRPEDIEILTDYFIRRVAGELDRPVPTISHEAVQKLQGYQWPNNVRELENCLRRAVSLCRENHLGLEDITFVNDNGSAPETRLRLVAPMTGHNGLLDDSQRSIIRTALDENNWNFTQTANELGIGRTTLWRKVKKYQLKRSAVTAE